MKTVKRTSQFKKDVKRMQKRGKAFDVFRDVIAELAAANPWIRSYMTTPSLANILARGSVISSLIGY